MILKSIQSRLQVWYGLVLLGVLAGFGLTAYQLERSAQWRRVDEELRRRFALTANSLRPPPGPEEGGPPEFGRSGAWRLPPPVEHLFDTNEPGGFFYAIRFEPGGEISRGGAAPQVAELKKLLLKVQASTKNMFDRPPNGHPPQPPPVQAILGYRQIAQPLPGGAIVIVGCAEAPTVRELRHVAIRLSAIGGFILLLGLLGGWGIAAHALRPISAIGAAAAKISAGDLSQRINTAETESELGRLAAVLNSAFARLGTAFAQQKQFAADAAHELRTPVAVLLTQTQTALQRERSAAEYRETLESCHRAAQRMRKLIGALLELARLDAGQELLKRDKFDLSQVARECVETIRPLAAERGVKIVSDLPPAEMSGDAERLAQVVTNLLSNAIQYNRAGGEARLEAKTQNGLVILSVSDTGTGITPEDLPRVFERFFRAEKSRTAANNGLGLAISKAIVEAHGGAIEVSSKENAGATFTLRLPAA
jgi:signal transduction histidine kinase